jgi:hypothetical protein
VAILLVLHILGVGLWLGCAGAETLLEIVGDRKPELKRTVIRLHYWIDLTVELPVVLLALVTGIALATQLPADGGWELAKRIIGLVALTANLGAIGAVIARERAARAGDERALERRQSLFGTLVVVAAPAALVALIIALARVG